MMKVDSQNKKEFLLTNDYVLCFCTFTRIAVINYNKDNYTNAMREIKLKENKLCISTHVKIS